MNYKNSEISQVPTVVLAKIQVLCDINAVQLSKLFLKFQGQTVQEDCLIIKVKALRSSEALQMFTQEQSVTFQQTWSFYDNLCVLFNTVIPLIYGTDFYSNICLPLSK